LAQRHNHLRYLFEDAEVTSRNGIVDQRHSVVELPFYYLCSILDGCSRYIVNWDLRESMTEADIEVILERAKK
jgi:putative transposase